MADKIAVLKFPLPVSCGVCRLNDNVGKLWRDEDEAVLDDTRRSSCCIVKKDTLEYTASRAPFCPLEVLEDG